MQISAQQLAELLLGVARAQAAMAHGLVGGGSAAAPAPEPSGALDFSKS